MESHVKYVESVNTIYNNGPMELLITYIVCWSSKDDNRMTPFHHLNTVFIIIPVNTFETHWNTNIFFETCGRWQPCHHFCRPML